ncbi:hypothetical protein PLICRDRAFT_549622 [Plicaturopsis crispa FD-325 SS-3]|nr:hypothetical protein PLICRDRAFT_549622 [Plicaturopsis crispa FD-325 SS-3]
MDTSHDHRIRKVCQRDETYEEAIRLFRIAAAKTRPGSGYDLGTGSVGLPSICAYIASLELGNGDVTEVVAQKSSCLNPKVFANTFNMVRSILPSVRSSKTTAAPREQSGMTYTRLVRKYKIGNADLVARWMEEAEKTLLAGDSRWNRNVEAVRCAVLYWMCGILKIQRTHREQLLDEYGIASKTFTSICKALDLVCDELVKRVQHSIKELREHMKNSGKVEFSQAASTDEGPETPSKKRKLASPSKASSSKVLPHHSVASSGSDDDDGAFPVTRARARLATKGQPSTPQFLSRGRSLSSAASSSAAAFDAAASYDVAPDAGLSTSSRSSPVAFAAEDASGAAMDVDAGSEQEEERQPPKRYRPVYRDRKQWLERDPRIEKSWEIWAAHRRNENAMD